MSGKEPVRRVIRCTPDNAAQIQQFVKQTPEVLALVKSLQSVGLFPGLRGLQITLTGTQEQVDRGLDGYLAAKAK